VLCKSIEDRTSLINHLKSNQIHAVFHYLSLHASPFYKSQHDGRILGQSDLFSETLLRLPMYFELTISEVIRITESIKSFYEK
jgi:dTDP-4-amino-4,6-dideoxygalactose transaminase